MTTMNVSLPAELKSWVEKQAKTGRFSNSSDYVRDLIRRDQERQAKIAHLQELIDEGIKSGVADLTMADIRQEARVRAELAGDIRIHPVKSHIVIYQIEPSGKILILRVRHGHEDWADDVPG